MTVQSLSGVPAFPPENSPHRVRWYKPTFSPEHGVLLIFLGAAMTGAALAQTWTAQTSWACLAAFLGLQAEHPIVVQVKRRRKWRPRYLFWAGVYGGSSMAIALWLSAQHPVLLWLCAAGLIALGIDIWAVFQRQHKSIRNEIMMFSALCLTTLLVYGATTGTVTVQAVGMWGLNSLFFSAAVFSVKLRKSKTDSLKGGLIYHIVAIAVVVLLYSLGWLSLFTALTFSVALIKFAVIAWQRRWYCTCRFEHVARFETYFALSYAALAALTVLPPKLPVA